MKVIFVLGMQGVGKSRWIEEHYPNQRRIDYEDGWLLAQSWVPELDRYEIATYVKQWATGAVITSLRNHQDPIIVETTGMSKVSQAAIRALRDMANIANYEIEVIYLKPSNYQAYVDTLAGNVDALSMLRDWNTGHPRFRRPQDCPYLSVQVVEIDHSQWASQEAETWQIERTE